MLVDYITSIFTRTINFNRGVKQGNPLNPTLFSAVLNELVSKLNREQPGETITPSQKISTLAFADDLLLLEDRDIDVPDALYKTCRFFKACSMEINPGRA